MAARTLGGAGWGDKPADVPAFQLTNTKRRKEKRTHEGRFIPGVHDRRTLRAMEGAMEREGEIRRLRSELAALRLMTGLAKLELKYREDQERVPKGEPGPGRFAKERGAGGSRLPAFVTPLAAAAARGAAAVEAGAVVGAGEAMALTGVLGAAMLGLTGDSRQPPLNIRQTSRRPGAPPAEPPPKGQFDAECEEQLKADLVDCKTIAAMYGRRSHLLSQIYAICERTAMARYSECLTGGVNAIKTPRYAAHHHTSPVRKR